LDPPDGYAVVISDMYMPEMTGLDFLAQVSAVSPSTLKIMLTGRADLATAMSAVNHTHVFGYFSKGEQIQELVTAVRKALAEHRKLSAQGARRPPAKDVLSREEIELLTRG